MRVISEISEDMLEEIHDAKHRIKRASEFKPLYPSVAQREYEIAVQELAHADKDHSSVVEFIATYKKEKGDPPAVMMSIWEWKHDQYMEEYAEVKAMIDMYAKA